MSNVTAVRSIYAAFGRGDILAILDKLAEDVDWDYAYRAVANPIPWLQPQRGKEGAAAFFRALQENLEIHRFAVSAPAEGSDLVVALFDIEATVKATGKRFVEQDEAHVWRFNDAGKVNRFRHCADTYQQAVALNR
jgi:ketosteroid isomerase-like protein